MPAEETVSETVPCAETIMRTLRVARLTAAPPLHTLAGPTQEIHRELDGESDLPPLRVRFLSWFEMQACLIITYQCPNTPEGVRACVYEEEDGQTCGTGSAHLKKAFLLLLLLWPVWAVLLS